MDKGEVFVGLDVSKEYLDVCVLPGKQVWRVENEPGSLRGLAERLGALRPMVVVMEATGGLEGPAMGILAAAGLPVTAINPKRARCFAESLGQRAKTDRIDACVLARFGESVRPAVRPLPDEATRALADLVTRRQQVIEMITAETNRRRCCSPQVARRIDAHLLWLKKELARLNKDLEKRLQASCIWQDEEKVLTSVPGVGPLSTCTLIALLPELGHMSRKKIAALVGVAPYNRDSGKHRGQRCICGGRAALRSALYMATLAATTHNPIIRDHYRRLLAKGKKAKVALVACMRKLLTILNAMVKQHIPWQPDLAKPR